MSKRQADQPEATVRTPSNPPGLRDLPFALPEVSPEQKRRARRLAKALEEHYPDAECELEYTSAHELLIATILSAQTTDVNVNKATPALFRAFPTPEAFASSTPDAIEPYVHSLGFFRNKARSVHESMAQIVERFEGRVPQTMDELLSLRGVARKTANVVLGNAFGINDGFVVDTHIERLSKRLGLAPQDASVQQVERWLCALLPRDRWMRLSHQFIWHGRRACQARRKGCSDHRVCKGFGQCCEFRVSAKTGAGSAPR